MVDGSPALIVGQGGIYSGRTGFFMKDLLKLGVPIYTQNMDAYGVETYKQYGTQGDRIDKAMTGGQAREKAHTEAT